MTELEHRLQLLEKASGESIPLCRGVELRKLDRIVTGIPLAVLGCYGYKTLDKNMSKDQYFYLVIDGQVAGDRQFKEIDVIVGLGKKVELFYKESLPIQVTDIRLPKSHGYSGIKYGFRRTVELFPKATLGRKRRRDAEVLIKPAA